MGVQVWLAKSSEACNTWGTMNLFPQTLDRVPYLIRSLVFVVALAVVYGILAAVSVPLLPHDDASPGVFVFLIGAVAFLIGLGAVVYGVVGLTIPRIRSCGWNPWLALLLLVPGVNTIFSLLLLFMPPVESSRL